MAAPLFFLNFAYNIFIITHMEENCEQGFLGVSIERKSGYIG
jgi:hypothetical protein